ncbi:MAG: ABC transporter ATP-binding protein [Methanomassiliicoccales archaeon]
MVGIKLELKGITKSYGKISVLNNIDMTVHENEFFAILGPSGAGKSTLLRIIIGVEEPDEGRIFIDGKDVTDLPPNRRNLSVVFQSYALYPNMTVFENIAFPLKMRGLSKQKIKTRVNEIATRLGISEILNRNATRISGGQKQRTALARALVRDPAIFLLDEPLSNLDARIRFRAREELRKLQEQFHQTFVYVTHDQAEIANLATRVAVLHNGKFEQVATYRELYEHPATVWVGDFIGNYPMNYLSAQLIDKNYSGCKIGFRTEWAEIDKNGNLIAKVESSEMIGDTYYLYCTIENEAFIVKSPSQVPVGEDVKVSIRRYNIFQDGMLLKNTLQVEAQI